MKPEASEHNNELGAFLPDEPRVIDKNESRDKWSNRLEFVLANIGYTVGIGTIWRFPMLFARNGGGAFLIPFCLVLVLLGVPLYHLEVNLGQFTGKGPCGAFEFCPLLKGTGFLMTTLMQITTWYYMTIMSWILYFLYNSFSTTLPWASCNNDWNTKWCQDINTTSSSRDTNMTINITSSTTWPTPSLEFWLHNVLGKSTGLEDIGHIQPHLVVCLAVAYTITTICLIKGVKTLGKVVYCTVPFPYILLTILLIRAVTLDGSMDGIRFCLQFKAEKLADTQVWLDASVMAFYSLGPIWGMVILTASHNKFKQPNFRDTVTICVVDTMSSLYAAIVVFSIIGFVAKQQGAAVEQLAKESGPGLAFVAYPTAVTMMPLPQLWAVLFFLMLLLVILDSAFGMIETCTDSLLELLPKRFKRFQVVITISYSLVMFLCALVFTTNGGIYLFQLLDWYSSAFALLIGAFFEVTSIALIYGIDRFSSDIVLMGGKNLARPVRILYCVFIPLAAFMTFVLMLVRYKKPYYGDGYIYKPYAIVLGICVGLVPIAVFFGVGIWSISSQEGTIYQKIKASLKPSKKWGPQDRIVAEAYRQNPYQYEKSLRKRWMTNLLGRERKPTGSDVGNNHHCDELTDYSK